MTRMDYTELCRFKKAYLIGIGGVGMSALARALRHLGFSVSGSDRVMNGNARALEASGIRVLVGGARQAFDATDIVIYSSAISKDHPEIRSALAQGARVCHRAEVLSSLMAHAPTAVAITGSHGKTTTSSMVSFVLARLGKNPTCLVGGNIVGFDTNAILGGPDLWVAEVDESDQSHEMYTPNYSIVTNLEVDHVDHYKNFELLKDSFARFFTLHHDPGLLVYPAGDSVLERLVAASGRPRLSFGFSPTADFSAREVEMNHYGSEFDLHEHGLFVCRVRLSVPGKHNIANALATLAVTAQLGVEPEEAAREIFGFHGVRRRLEVKLDSPELSVIDDYAHHPTEIRASITALREMGKRLTVVFQPHRYSRTQYFFEEFARSLEGADEIILTDVYGAGESNPSHVGAGLILDEIVKNGHPRVQLLPKQVMMEHLLNRGDLNGVLAFLGAGDIGEIANEFANRFRSLTAT